MGTPAVSILVPTFNGRRYIVSALTSLRVQNCVDLEIVVVDDASTDDTVRIVEDEMLADPRIRLVRANDRSIAASRNDALRHARGDLIGFLDQDDLCPQDKIYRQMELLTEKPDTLAVFGRTVIFTSVETNPAKILAESETSTLTMCLSAALFRRKVFDQVGLFDLRYKLADDFDMILRLVEAGVAIEIEEHIGTLHRRHDAQATADLKATKREALLALAASLRRRRAAGHATDMQHPFLSAILP